MILVDLSEREEDGLEYIVDAGNDMVMNVQRPVCTNPICTIPRYTQTEYKVR